MNLTPNMQTILVAILEEMRRLEAVGDRPPPGMDWDLWRGLWREGEEYRQFGVPHDLARWLGYPPTSSDSAVFSRALRTMEAMGLLVRINHYGGRRATHVQLSDLGRAEARRLVQEQEAAMEALLANLGPLEVPEPEGGRAEDEVGGHPPSGGTSVGKTPGDVTA